MELSFWHARAPARYEKHGRRMIWMLGLQLALSSVVGAIVLAAAARAEDNDTAAVSEQDVEAKMQFCEVCHGPSAQGIIGRRETVPRLAGQQPEYIKNQLQAFIDRGRLNPTMANVAHFLSPAMQTGLASHFHELNPKPLGGGPKDLVAAGKKIFEEGIPASDIPPCAMCHGPEAKGDGQFPRLAGQLYPYIVRQLGDFSKERGQNPEKPDTSAIMQPIAHSLIESQIKAVAAYVSTLE